MNINAVCRTDQERLDALDSAIKRGLEDAAKGRVMSADKAFGGLERKYRRKVELSAEKG